jgi:hypothetical protein
MVAVRMAPSGAPGFVCLDGSGRHVAQGIQQLIELSSLLANRVLDNVEPRQ